MKKRIALVAKGEEALDLLMGQLSEYFEPYCEVEGYLIDRPMRMLDHVDKVLLTSRSPDIYQAAMRYIPATVPIWVVKRLFEPRKLKWLMQIPGGTEVLVINNLHDTCNEVIQTLLEANIRHLKYVPFYPGVSLEHDRYRYAITLGVPDVMPLQSVEIIDIGIRRIHIHDLIELGRQLNVPLEREQQYLSRYISEIHELGIELGKSFVDIQHLHTHLQSVLEAVQEPIFSCSQSEELTFMNGLAADLFDCSGKDVNGMLLEQLPLMEPILPYIHLGYQHDEALVELKGQQFVVNCIRMERLEQYFGTVCLLKNVTEIQSLERRLRKVIADKGHVASYTFAQIVGESEALLGAIEKAKKMAGNNRSILITGENGTGKELFTHAIHRESPRRNGPFVAINCASLPENLLESEIFGYEEGAFTGARKGGKPGVFEQADGGTIFLDEIGDISPAIQVRLLRVLQEKQVVRVGGTKILSVDVRVIAATNRNLEHAVRQGRFREDLYYRLSVLPIEIPPLRERKDDIPLLLRQHLKKLKEERIWDKQVLELFFRYDWPGNIRELINVVEYAVTVSDQQVITVHDIPDKLRTAQPFRETVQNQAELDREDWEILRCLHLYARPNSGVGRYELARLPELRNLGLTEQRLRTKIKRLDTKGLVASGTTRQGTQLTAQGLRLLKAAGPEGRDGVSI